MLELYEARTERQIGRGIMGKSRDVLEMNETYVSGRKTEVGGNEGSVRWDLDLNRR